MSIKELKEELAANIAARDCAPKGVSVLSELYDQNIVYDYHYRFRIEFLREQICFLESADRGEELISVLVLPINLNKANSFETFLTDAKVYRNLILFNKQVFVNMIRMYRLTLIIPLSNKEQFFNLVEEISWK